MQSQFPSASNPPFPNLRGYRRRSSFFCRMDLSCFFVSGSFPEICQFSSLSFSNSILRSPSSSMPPWSSAPSLRHSVGAIRNAGIGLQYFPERVLVSGVGREREREKEGGMGRGKGGREIKGMGGHHALLPAPSKSGHLVLQLIHHNFTDAQHIATNRDECGRGKC